MGISATFTAVKCPVCGAVVIMMTCETDGLLVGTCGNCGAKVEKRRGEPPKVVQPS